MAEHNETVEVNTEMSDTKLSNTCTCSEEKQKLSEFTAKKWFCDL